MHPYMIGLLLRVHDEELDRAADAWRSARREGSLRLHHGGGLGYGRAWRGSHGEPEQVGPMAVPERIALGR